MCLLCAAWGSNAGSHAYMAYTLSIEPPFQPPACFTKQTLLLHWHLQRGVSGFCIYRPGLGWYILKPFMITLGSLNYTGYSGPRHIMIFANKIKKKLRAKMPCKLKQNTESSVAQSSQGHGMVTSPALHSWGFHKLPTAGTFFSHLFFPSPSHKALGR